MWNAAVSAEFVSGHSSDGKRSYEVYVITTKGGFPAWGDLLGKPGKGPDINGQPSQWWRVAAPDTKPVVVQGTATPAPQKSKKPVEGAAVLRWEWAPGAYAQVRVEGFDNPLDTAARMARSVRLDEQTPFTMPLTISQPHGMRALRTAGTGSTANRIIEFGKVFGEHPSVLASLNAVRTDKNIPGPNTTLGGHPAREDLFALGTMWEIQMGNGQELLLECMAANETPAVKTANRAECRRVAASAQPVGTPGKPSTWSTSPVR
jgi:hypothetical protein